MALTIDVLSSASDDWDGLVRRTPLPDVQQASIWADYWSALVPMRPRFYVARNAGAAVGGLLVLEIPPAPHLGDQPFGGLVLRALRHLRPVWMWRNGPSTPAADPWRVETARALIERVLVDARRARAAVDATLPLGEPAPALGVPGLIDRERTTALVDLGRGEEAMWEGLPKDVRKSVNRARRLGVVVRRAQPHEYGRYERLIAIHRHSLGLPAFRRAHALHIVAILSRLAHPDGVDVLVAERAGEWLGAIGVWSFAGRATEFGLCRMVGNDADAVAGDLLKWETFRWAIARGCTTFDVAGINLGGTEKERGIARFKLKWGGAVITYRELLMER